MIQVELHDSRTPSSRSASFLIHRSDPDVATYSMLSGGIDGCIVHLLRKGPLEAAFTDRFSFVVESVSFGLDQQEEVNAWITVAGRGTLSLLEGRLCLPPGFDGINASSITNQLGQAYVAQSGGFIMDAEIDRSAGRFTPAITPACRQARSDSQSPCASTICVNPNTTITVLTAGTFTTCTYNASAQIKQIL